MYIWELHGVCRELYQAFGFRSGPASFVWNCWCSHVCLTMGQGLFHLITAFSSSPWYKQKHACYFRLVSHFYHLPTAVQGLRFRRAKITSAHSTVNDKSLVFRFTACWRWPCNLFRVSLLVFTAEAYTLDTPTKPVLASLMCRSNRPPHIPSSSLKLPDVSSRTAIDTSAAACLFPEADHRKNSRSQTLRSEASHTSSIPPESGPRHHFFA